MKFDTYTYTDAELEIFLDNAKTTVIRALVADGFLEYEAADNWCAKHTIKLEPKTLWRTLSNKWTDAKEATGHWFLTVVTRP